MMKGDVVRAGEVNGAGNIPSVGERRCGEVDRFSGSEEFPVGRVGTRPFGFSGLGQGERGAATFDRTSDSQRFASNANSRQSDDAPQPSSPIREVKLLIRVGFLEAVQLQPELLLNRIKDRWFVNHGREESIVQIDFVYVLEFRSVNNGPIVQSRLCTEEGNKPLHGPSPGRLASIAAPLWIPHQSNAPARLGFVIEVHSAHLGLFVATTSA
jgi:hypothetical protein